MFIDNCGLFACENVIFIAVQIASHVSIIFDVACVNLLGTMDDDCACTAVPDPTSASSDSVSSDSSSSQEFVP